LRLFITLNSHYFHTCKLFLYFKCEEGVLRAGCDTGLANGIWKLFVEGKKVSGLAHQYTVELSDKEARIFKMIIDAHYDTQKGIWFRVGNGELSKKEALLLLEKELPMAILARKLKSE